MCSSDLATTSTDPISALPIAVIRHAEQDGDARPFTCEPVIVVELLERYAVKTVKLAFDVAGTFDAFRQGTVKIVAHTGPDTTLTVFEGDWNSTLICRFAEGVECEALTVICTRKTQGGVVPAADGAANPVKYRQLNLLDDFATLGKFDVIFCRNVLIYFDPATKARTLEAVANILAPDGALILGSAETVVGLAGSFEPQQGLRGVFRRKATSQRAVA